MTEPPATAYETRDEWKSFFQSLSDQELQGIALIRVIECTNGCIQHTFRDNHPKALPIEQTREAMKYSMSLMKTYKVDLPGVEVSFSEETLSNLHKIRELYISAFKRGEESAMYKFFEASEACVEVVGMSRIEDAATVVKSQLIEVFPPHTVDWGVAYLERMLTS